MSVVPPRLGSLINKNPVDDATGKSQPHSLLGYSSLPADTLHLDNGGVSV